MTSSLYISTTEPGSGKALMSLGILELILRKTTKVGFFRPIIRETPNGKKDEDIDLMITHFQLEQTYSESFGLFYKDANDLIGKKQHGEVVERIIAKYKELEKKCDFILCEGSDYLGDSSAFEFNLNIEIAKNLSCPILILGNGYEKSVEEAKSSVQIALESYEEEECQVIGIVVNKVNPEIVDNLHKALFKENKNSNYLIAVIPFKQKLSSPRVKEIAEQLEAEVLYGHQRLNSLVSHYLIAAMQMQHALPRLKEDTLVITPGDRGDMIIGVLQAHQSANYPNLSGLLLSTGLKPEASIAKLIEGLNDPLPILSVQTETYETASKVHDVHSSITPADQEKIALSIKTFDKYVDLEKLESQIRTIKFKGITPKMFTYNLMQRAKLQQSHIVLPEGNEPRILEATSVLLAREIVEITLLGKREEIEQTIKKHGIQLDMKRLRIINPVESEKLTEYAQKFYELRKHKGMTEEGAKEYMMDVSYFGTMMVYAGDADGMVSGAVHTTGHTIRPALQFIKTKPDCSVVSSVFFMCLEDRVLVYGDCAVNPNPTAEQLAEIALSSAETAQRFGVEPLVALLSYSSGTSGEGEDVEKVREATQIAKKRQPDLKLDGPMQYDAAVDLSVAAQKMPESEVAGKASVLIFPDLNTGNNTYKAVQRETGAIAIGPVLQGLRKPVNDLSRGCTVADIVNTVAITAIQT
ncbi:MAG: phosphate acetyltransferase [Gomphosphaeria aponina SAG 52.96 = DSM 107014]|uniref:Phosphate acetyltransferase n=1 Tax=Gomphosphaeria aponina SAG 52.96 = DSM 107014 TaxID=1521640 RepID=A0A941JUU9_9CHRO|nr:phosphate acetyltransferase [Gomphosphaeria aponina SAG 52.96 = DSM 107014]